MLNLNWMKITKLMAYCLIIIESILYLVRLPSFFNSLTVACKQQPCMRIQLPEQFLAGSTSDFSFTTYASYFTILETLTLFIFLFTGYLLLRHGPNQTISIYTAIMLSTFILRFSVNIESLSQSHSLLALPTQWLLTLGTIFVMVIIFLFPNGKFVPKFTRLIMVIWFILCIISDYAPASWLFSKKGDSYLFPLISIFFIGVGLMSQWYRYRKTSDWTERQQMKWVGMGFSITLILLMVNINWLIPFIHTSGSIHWFIIGSTLFYVALWMIPITFLIALLEYRLWNINIILHRTLLYGLLTLIVSVIFALVIGGLGTILPTAGQTIIASILVSIIFLPVQKKLQVWVSRLVYGKRNDPYHVISEFSQKLSTVINVDEMISTFLNTIVKTLKIPYAAIKLYTEEGLIPFSAIGEKSGPTLAVPIQYKEDSIGELIVSPRGLNEKWNDVDLSLLKELGRQMGTSIQALRVTKDLQQSNRDLLQARKRLITSKEEERKRIQQDLHDGHLPTLAALSLKINAAGRLVDKQADKAKNLLTEIHQHLTQAVDEIRKLVHGLRPPSLEMGLNLAIQDFINHFSKSIKERQTQKLEFNVNIPENISDHITAAEEVALYFIIREAISNTIKHSKAKNCWVHLKKQTDSLLLEVRDDGVGINPLNQKGIGIRSMKERTEELGGYYSMVTSDKGTCIKAMFKLEIGE